MSFHEYPYTNFHEMNLDWVVKKVKELAAAWAQVQQDWTDEQAAFANLQSWIENYFNNLDVQTEINVKLDAMVAAGTMSELIAPYVSSGLPAEVAEQIGDVVAAQIGPVVAAQISAVVADQLPAVAAAAAAQEVSAWLALHVNPETGYVIDDTFTVQGAAADAKAVGDEFTAIKSALSEVDDDVTYLNNEVGKYILGTNTVSTKGSYARKPVFSNISLEANKSYKFSFARITSITFYAYYVVDNVEVNSYTIASDDFSFVITPSENTTATIKVSSVTAGSITCQWGYNTNKTRIDSIEDKVALLFDGTKVVTYSLLSGLYVKSDGTLNYDADSKASSYIPVRPNDVLQIENLNIVGGRSICAYDDNRNFIEVLYTASNDTIKTFTIKNGCYYIRFTAQKTGTTKVTFLSIPKYIDDNAIRYLDVSITNGMYITCASGYEGREAPDEDSAATDYISVLPNASICIRNTFLSGNRSVCAYDKNKVFCAVLVASTNNQLLDVDNIKIPSNARYIRISSHKDTTPEVWYSDYVISDKFIIPQYVSNRVLFDTSANKPVLSIVDDDTWGAEYVTKLKNLCDANNVKLSWACLTSRLDQTFANLLLQYEQEGFPVIMHGKTQGTFYRDDILADMENDLLQAMHTMNGYGFADYKIWAVPYGSTGTNARLLAHKWGFDGAIQCNYSNAFENPYVRRNFDQRYSIIRYSFDDATHVDAVKSLIDDAKLVNGWVLIATHSAHEAYYSGDNDDAFGEVIQYARDNGFEIRTINEELRRRMPIYNYYEKY